MFRGVRCGVVSLIDSKFEDEVVAMMRIILSDHLSTIPTSLHRPATSNRVLGIGILALRYDDKGHEGLTRRALGDVVESSNYFFFP